LEVRDVDLNAMSTSENWEYVMLDTLPVAETNNNQYENEEEEQEVHKDSDHKADSSEDKNELGDLDMPPSW